MPGYDVGRRLVDIDVGWHPLILDDPSVLGPDGQIGSGDEAAVHQLRKSEDSDQAAPGAPAHQGAHLELMEHPGEQIAAGAGGLVDDHDLRPLDGCQRSLEIAAVSHGPVTDHRTAEDVDVIVGDASPTIVAFIHDDRFTVGLREEVALEVGVSEVGGVRDIDISDPSVRGLGHLAEVPLHPVAISEGQLVFHRNDLHDARAAPVGVRPDCQLDDAAGRLLETAI